MGTVDKIAVKMYQYLGASESVAKHSSKQLAGILRTQMKGKPRAAKKEFLKACQTLTNESGAGTEKAKQVILNTFTKGKDSLEKVAGIRAAYDGIIIPMSMKRAVNNLNAELPKVISDAMTHSIDDIFAKTFTPENVSKIAKDALKESAKQTAKETGIGLFRLTTYPVNKALSYTVPKHLRGLYSETAKLSRENFANGYFEKLVTLKGLSGRAPLNVEVTKDAAPFGVKVSGGFNHITNKISYTKELPTLSRSAQAKMLNHELKHFEQFDSVIRTVGVDRYIQALKKQAFNILQRLYGAQKTEQELLNMVEESFRKDNIGETVKKAFEQSSKAPKIDPKSKEGIQALKYLDAIEQYQAPIKKDPFGIIVDIPKEYFNNLLEKEAYSAGRRAGFEMGVFENLNLISI